MSEGSLKFEKFLSEEACIAYGPGWSGTIEKDVRDRAHTTHSLQVMDALRDAVGLPIRISASLTAGAFHFASVNS